MPKELNEIEIHPLADLHIGDAMSDWSLIQSEIKRVLETPNAYCVLDGDLMDTAIASSIGDTYSSTHNPMEQLQECVNLFAPIKDKIIAVVGGNHENRIYRSDGIDITQLMCSQLGISDRYSPTTALVFIRFGDDKKHRKVCYSLYMTHGNGGGRKEGGKINRLADLAGIVDADIYLMAHVHQPAAFRNRFYRCDPQNSSAQLIEHLFVNTAAWLNYGGYGDKAGFKPASTINPTIILDGHKKRASATI